jgi:glycosyltransferase involved in cell wall biosynthesis
MLKCSVIIPTYNRESLLRHTLESLTRQSLPRDQFEVLVADDGSSDATASMVEGFKDRLNLRYSFQEDQGFRAAKARNMSIADARSDICVFLDSGMLAHSRFLAAHVASHAATDGPAAVVGYVYGLMLDGFDETAGPIRQTVDVGDVDGSVALIRDKQLWLDVRDEFYEKYGDDFGWLPAPWVIYWSLNISAGTQMLRDVGMFDEAFTSWGGEDIDLGYRLHRAGASFLLNRNAVAIHLPHEKADTRTEGGNYLYIVDKYGTPITSLLAQYVTRELGPFEINDIISERGLSSGNENVTQRHEG